MSSRDPRLLLEDMIKASTLILKYVEGYDYSAFCNDRKTIDAVLRNLIILGEAANRMPEAFREQNPDIEWIKIARSRHVVVHDYFDVDLEIIWRIITTYVPDLKKKLTDIVTVR